MCYILSLVRHFHDSHYSGKGYDDMQSVVVHVFEQGHVPCFDLIQASGLECLGRSVAWPNL